MLQFSPRREAERLRMELVGPTPALTLLHGPPGVGKAEVVRDAMAGVDVIAYWAPTLPDSDQRASLVARLGSWAHAPQAAPALAPRLRPRQGGPLLPSADWSQIFDHLVERAAERRAPLRLILQEFPRLVEARSKLLGELERFWSRVRANGLPVHLVLTGRDGPVLHGLRREESPFARWISADLPVSPLGPREVARLFPSYPVRERLLVWTIFGGLPRHLRSCDPGVSLASNVRQALLSPESPLLLSGIEQLQIELQSPARYASVLSVLARGRWEWGEILAAAPDFASGGQMAPYLGRLQELGLVVGESSLDAAPGSRHRRYHVPSPFVAVWYRFVLPHLTEILSGRGKEVWRIHVLPNLEEHAARFFPWACRDHLLEHAAETLGATAREIGGLWGADYDIPLAGTLRNGAAFYGRAFWGAGRVPELADEVLHEEIRHTRYGFAKEGRIRLIFSTDGFSPALVRRAARSDVLHLLGAEELLGG